MILDKPKRTKIRELGGGASYLRVWPCFSSAMFKFACEMAKPSETTSFRTLMALPVAAVVQSTRALEALLTEELEKAVTMWAASWESPH